jgi:hypothetical protein
MANNPPELEPPYLEPTPYLRCTPRTAERGRESRPHSRYSIHNSLCPCEDRLVLREPPGVELTGNALNQLALLARLRDRNAALVVQPADYGFETFDNIGSHVCLHRLGRFQDFGKGFRTRGESSGAPQYQRMHPVWPWLHAAVLDGRGGRRLAVTTQIATVCHVRNPRALTPDHLHYDDTRRIRQAFSRRARY